MTEQGRSTEERERARIAREAARRGNESEPALRPDRNLTSNSSSSPVMMRRRRLAVFGGALAALLIFWVLQSYFQPFRGDGDGNVAIAIPNGADVGEVATLLADRDVIARPLFFKLRARFSGQASEIKAGRYALRKNMSNAAALSILADGPNATVTRIVIPEGRSRYEIAASVSAAGLTGDYLAASKSRPGFSLKQFGATKPADLEGFLFPATYELPAGADVSKLVGQQLKAFKQQFSGLGLSYARSKNLTPFDVIVVASLVEREVQVPSERRKVAAVIYNRLRQGIPLGIDATTRFETRNWQEPLTNADLRKDTPYNTRLNNGLPPGPIGNPGLASLKAAARPARVGYLYYVANPCKPGTHTFTTTDAAFQRAVSRYNEARAKAGGAQPKGC